MIWTGDCRQILASLDEASIDACVTDPPYGLSFMGRGWDAKVPGPDYWREVFRVLKPGALLVAFSAPRLQHRLATAIEDAGFELRDTLMWLFAQGFPKSHNVSKAIDRQRTEDLPRIYAVTAYVRGARDRAGLTNARIDAAFGTNGMAGHWTSGASQPAVPTVAQWAELKRLLAFGDEMDAEVEALNARKGQPGDAWDRREVIGAGASGATAIWSDGGMGAYDITVPATPEAARFEGWGTALAPAYEPIILARKPLEGTVASNALKWGTGGVNVDGCRVGDSKRTPGYSTPTKATFAPSSYGMRGHTEVDPDTGRWPSNLILSCYCDGDNHEPGCPAGDLDAQAGERKSGSRAEGVRSGVGYHGGRGDGGPAIEANAGGASRFFFCPKASRREREAGLELFEAMTVSDGRSEVNDTPYLRDATERKNLHPTVKPIALMRWLIRLITPPGGTILDPFLGSGTTLCAAALEPCVKRAIGIELQEHHARLAEARATYWRRMSLIPPEDRRNLKKREHVPEQVSLFGGAES